MNTPCSLYMSMDLSTILNFVRVFRTKPNISKTSGTFVPNIQTVSINIQGLFDTYQTKIEHKKKQFCINMVQHNLHVGANLSKSILNMKTYQKICLIQSSIIGQNSSRLTPIALAIFPSVDQLKGILQN